MKRFSLLEILIPLWSARHSNPMHSHCAASKMRGGLPFLAVPGPISYKHSCKICCLANSFAIIKEMVKVVVPPPPHARPFLTLKYLLWWYGYLLFTLCQRAWRNNHMCILNGTDRYPNNPTHIHSSGVVHLNQRWQLGYSIPQNALVHMFSVVVFFNTVFDLCNSTASSSWVLQNAMCCSGAMACNNRGHILPLSRMLLGKLLVEGLKGQLLWTRVYSAVHWDQIKQDLPLW